MREFQCHSSCPQIKSVDLLPGHCDINDTLVIPFFWEACGWRSKTLDHCSHVVIKGKIALLKSWEIAAPSVIDSHCVHGAGLQLALAALRATPRHHQPHLVISQQTGGRCSPHMAGPPAAQRLQLSMAREQPGTGAVPALAPHLSPRPERCHLLLVLLWG